MISPLVAVALGRDLWAPYEPRYATVVRWIYQRGEFLVLRHCGYLCWDKLQLVCWLSGWSVPLRRLVSLVLMAGVAWFTERLAALWL